MDEHRFDTVREPMNSPMEGRRTSLLTSIYRAFNALDRDDDGQGLAEYALILALIAIVAIVALLLLGGQVSKVLSTVGKSV